MTRRISILIAVTLLGAPWLASDLASAPLLRLAGTVRSEGSSHWRVQLTPHSGPSRIATLDGVGSSEAICSRVSVRTRAFGERGVVRTRLDTMRAIKMLDAGIATIEFIDGTSQRVVVAADNRVLYLRDDAGRTQRVDLGELAAVEFLR